VQGVQWHATSQPPNIWSSCSTRRRVLCSPLGRATLLSTRPQWQCGSVPRGLKGLSQPPAQLQGIELPTDPQAEDLLLGPVPHMVRLGVRPSQTSFNLAAVKGLPGRNHAWLGPVGLAWNRVGDPKAATPQQEEDALNRCGRSPANTRTSRFWDALIGVCTAVTSIMIISTPISWNAWHCATSWDAERVPCACSASTEDVPPAAKAHPQVGRLGRGQPQGNAQRNLTSSCACTAPQATTCFKQR
jgi:hypothetical protein